MKPRTWGSAPPKHSTASVEAQIRTATWMVRGCFVAFLLALSLVVIALLERRSLRGYASSLIFAPLHLYLFTHHWRRRQALKKLRVPS
jgi:hypothetical protein